MQPLLQFVVLGVKLVVSDAAVDFDGIAFFPVWVYGVDVNGFTVVACGKSSIDVIDADVLVENGCRRGNGDTDCESDEDAEEMHFYGGVARQKSRLSERRWIERRRFGGRLT